LIVFKSVRAEANGERSASSRQCLAAEAERERSPTHAKAGKNLGRRVVRRKPATALPYFLPANALPQRTQARRQP